MKHFKHFLPPIAGALALQLASVASHAELPSGIGWRALPNTKLRTVCATAQGFSQVGGVEGCPAVTHAWSGGAFDTRRNRLIIWGGGHNSYYGNELYAVNLDTQTVQRLNDPGLPPASYSPCVDSVANGSQPNSRHTYDGMEYIEKLDKLYVFSGSLACGAGNFGEDTWTFDFPTMKWTRMKPTGDVPDGDAGMLTAYDPNSGLIYLHDRRHLYSYDPVADRYTRLSSRQVSLGYHLAATIDPKRRQFVIVGYDSAAGAGRVRSYDIGAGSTYEMKTLSTTGGDPVVGVIYPGLDYDPVSDRIVAWGEKSGGAVHLLNLDTNAWSAQTFSGAPTPVGNGTHGRWRYSPASGVFVVANSIDADVSILRLSDKTLARPNPPTALTAQ